MLDLSKPLFYVDDDGEQFPARLLASDIKGDYPIVSAITEADRTEFIRTFTKEGAEYYDNPARHSSALVNRPPITMYVNVYQIQGGRYITGDLYKTPDDARAHSSDCTVAVGLPITF